MARPEEKFECKLCFHLLTFDRKFLVKRHIMEQHSGFAFTCTGSQMIFPRRDNHTSCHGKYSSSRKMEVVRRSDGMRSSRAQEELEKYTSRIDDFIRVVSQRSFRELSLHPLAGSPAPRRQMPDPIEELSLPPLECLRNQRGLDAVRDHLPP